MSQNIVLPTTRLQPGSAHSHDARAAVVRQRPAISVALIALAAMASCTAWGAQVAAPAKVLRLPAAPQPMHVGPPPVAQVGPHVMAPAGFKGGRQLCPAYPLSLTGQPTPVTYAGPAGTGTSVSWNVGTSGVPAGARLNSWQFEIRLASNPSQVLVQQSATVAITVNQAPSVLPSPADPHPAAPCVGAPSNGFANETLTLNAGQLQSLQTTYGFQALQHLVIWRSFTYLDSQGLAHPVQVSNPLSIVAPPPVH